MNLRRSILKGVVGLGAGLSVALKELGAAQDDPASLRPREGDFLVRIADPTATPLAADDIPMGAAPTMAWAMDPVGHTVRSGSRFNRIVLVKLDTAMLGAETQPLAASGVVAYTAICTHAGCDVDEWLPEEHVLYCSCHSSKFDARNGARVVDGPAPRSLPALPLRVIDERDRRLVVAGPFTSRVGFESGGQKQ